MYKSQETIFTEEQTQLADSIQLHCETVLYRYKHRVFLVGNSVAARPIRVVPMYPILPRQPISSPVSSAWQF